MSFSPPSSSAEIRQTVLELLNQLGDSREARDYVRRFGEKGVTQFAVIKVGGGVLAEEPDSLAWALSFLQRLGLLPIVIHGAGPQLDEGLEAAGFRKETIDGQRVTTPESMSLARRIVTAENLKLTDALESRGARTRSLTQGIFEAEQHDPRLGLVGRVTEVHLEPVRQVLRGGAIPVISCFGETRTGQALNINADNATTAMALATRPQKIVYLTPTGGILDESGQIISAINLKTDYHALLTESWLHSGMRLKLQQIAELLDQLPPSTSVSVTSAANLTRELFTHSGRGTLIRRGEEFERIALVQAEKRPLAELIEACFGRTLREGYLEDKPEWEVIRSRSNRAAALLDCSDKAPYLDKFAVTPEAQGEGLGAALWAELKRRYQSFCWRCRSDNEILGWYQRQADWSVRTEKWWVLGCGECASRIEYWRETVQKRPTSWQ